MPLLKLFFCPLRMKVVLPRFQSGETREGFPGADSGERAVQCLVGCLSLPVGWGGRFRRVFSARRWAG